MKFLLYLKLSLFLWLIENIILFLCLFENNLWLFKVPTAMERATPAANVPAKEDLPVEIVQLGEFWLILG